jgi:hypothetical protein
MKKKPELKNLVTLSLQELTIAFYTSYTLPVLEARLWIRIGSGFSDFVDPDPYWESVSRIRIQGQEN